MPLDGTVYDLETGKVLVWCPKNNPLRFVLGSLKVCQPTSDDACQTHQEGLDVLGCAMTLHRYECDVLSQSELACTSYSILSAALEAFLPAGLSSAMCCAVHSGPTAPQDVLSAGEQQRANLCKACTNLTEGVEWK